jgi:hypothetical protein
MKTYTLNEIRMYLQSQDSFGDCLYNLKNIDEILEKLNQNEDENNKNK